MCIRDSWGASLAWVLALVTMVNMVCYGPLYTNLSVVLNGGGTEMCIRDRFIPTKDRHHMRKRKVH